jgi:muramoyltetrapeptide carboxypeptidase LdcA involved in peptidoglycan recycling
MAIKPKRLTKGDTVAIVSQSSGAPKQFPHIYEKGVQNLRDFFGVKIKEYPTTRADRDFLYTHPEARAKDLNDAFLDPEVDAIFSSIGGDDSVRILPFLDFKTIRDHPKIFMGFSDATTVTTTVNSQSDLVTFNGPSIMAGFSQMKEFPESFAHHVREILFQRSKYPYVYSPFRYYSEGYPDWSNVENAGKVNQKKDNLAGWNWIQLGREARIKGLLFGGCMEVLEFIKGTKFWPGINENFWDGKILFFETSEVKPQVEFVKWWLRNYGSQGILEKASAILFARPTFYSEKEKESLWKSVIDVVKVEFKRPDIPIIADMDFGHTDPRFIIPLGVEAEIDSERKSFSLAESPTN